jgi:hypothetical protein
MEDQAPTSTDGLKRTSADVGSPGLMHVEVSVRTRPGLR